MKITTNAELDRAVKALGRTPTEVADSLREKGITGTRSAAGRCPLANYLKTAENITEDHDVTFYYVAIILPPSLGVSLRVEQCPNGQRSAALQFAEAFDRGEYPDLVQARG